MANTMITYKCGHTATATLSPEALTQLAEASRALYHATSYLSTAAEILCRDVSDPHTDSTHDMKRFLQSASRFLDAFAGFSPCWPLIGRGTPELDAPEIDRIAELEAENARIKAKAAETETECNREYARWLEASRKNADEIADLKAKLANEKKSVELQAARIAELEADNRTARVAQIQAERDVQERDHIISKQNAELLKLKARVAKLERTTTETTPAALNMGTTTDDAEAALKTL